MTVFQLIISIVCFGVAFFGAKAAARATKAEFKKSGQNLTNTCWALSKLLAFIVIPGYLAGTLLTGTLALSVFLISIAAAIFGQVVGMRK